MYITDTENSQVNFGVFQSFIVFVMNVFIEYLPQMQGPTERSLFPEHVPGRFPYFWWQCTTETGKYRNYRNRNFGWLYRTETETTEPKRIVYILDFAINWLHKKLLIMVLCLVV